MIFIKNTKAMIRSPYGDTDFYDIFAGVLLGDTYITPYWLIICLDYVLRAFDKSLKMSLHQKNKKQEADDISQKLSQMQTTQMI